MTQYLKHPPLLEGALAPDPLAQLQQWLDDAAAAGMLEPGAMTLATADAQGRPSARIVLFKGFADGGLAFYTNYEGRKAQELLQNPHAALVFWWDQLERQVRVEGAVSKLSRAQSEQYFDSRPRASQLGAWASQQSRSVADRAALDAALDKVTRTHEHRNVPCPPFWGGYRLLPQRFEFWQGRRDRLHDRLLYLQEDPGWRTLRLQP